MKARKECMHCTETEGLDLCINVPVIQRTGVVWSPCCGHWGLSPAAWCLDELWCTTSCQCEYLICIDKKRLEKVSTWFQILEKPLMGGWDWFNCLSVEIYNTCHSQL